MAQSQLSLINRLPTKQIQTNAVYLKQKADGPLCPQSGHSIYDRSLASGRGWLRISGCRDTSQFPLDHCCAQIWFCRHKGPVKCSLRREVSPPHTVPRVMTKEQNII